MPREMQFEVDDEESLHDLILQSIIIILGVKGVMQTEKACHKNNSHTFRRERNKTMQFHLKTGIGMTCNRDAASLSSLLHFRLLFKWQTVDHYYHYCHSRLHPKVKNVIRMTITVYLISYPFEGDVS